MNRKRFLSTVVPLTAFTSAFAKPARAGFLSQSASVSTSSAQIPFLKKGDTIGITCPSGFITANECTSAIYKMQEWGFRVKIGNTIGAKDFTFAGTDQERRDDMQRMLNDREIKAILLARGGYGAVRIIDSLDFTEFKNNPKWIIGFSDATIFHLHLNNLGIPTIHSKMCNSFPDDFSKADEIQIATIESIRQCLTGGPMKYMASHQPQNRPGTATGELIGGNLSLIDNVCGSSSDINTDGKILFLEDVGEYPYKIDGMLWGLRRSGKLSNLAALVIGSFRLKTDDENAPFGLSLYEMVHEKVKDYSYPVCFNFPVGHVKENYALTCGVRHSLTVDENGATLIKL